MDQQRLVKFCKGLKVLRVSSDDISWVLTDYPVWLKHYTSLRTFEAYLVSDSCERGVESVLKNFFNGELDDWTISDDYSSIEGHSTAEIADWICEEAIHWKLPTYEEWREEARHRPAYETLFKMNIETFRQSALDFLISLHLPWIDFVEPEYTHEDEAILAGYVNELIAEFELRWPRLQE